MKRGRRISRRRDRWNDTGMGGAEAKTRLLESRGGFGGDCGDLARGTSEAGGPSSLSNTYRSLRVGHLFRALIVVASFRFEGRRCRRARPRVVPRRPDRKTA